MIKVEAEFDVEYGRDYREQPDKELKIGGYQSRIFSTSIRIERFSWAATPDIGMHPTANSSDVIENLSIAALCARRMMRC